MNATPLPGDLAQVATPEPILRSISRTPREVQKKMTILAIEDDHSIHSLYRCALDKQRFTLFSRFDGTSGLEAAAQLKPDLILLDLSLPDISGVFICKYLKSDPRTKDIPIMFVTGALSMDDMLSEVDLDASDFMLKPFSDDELVLRIESMLQNQTVLPVKSQTANDVVNSATWNSIEEIQKQMKARNYRIALNWRDMGQTVDDYIQYLSRLRQNIVDEQKPRVVSFNAIH